VTLNDVVPGIGSTLSELANIFIVKVGRVGRALTFFNNRKVVTSERT